MDGCCWRAQGCLYWLNMNSYIRAYITKCLTCWKYEVANPEEPLINHESPKRLGAEVGVDLFLFEGRDYLCTVDYISNFWEVDYLQSMDTKLMHHFAIYGIPDQVFTDNVPQFQSRKLDGFVGKWCFTHTHISPYNSKANCKVKSMIKMVISGKSKPCRQIYI